MSLFMENTEISAESTVLQIQNILGRYGARAVMLEYDENRQISGLAFEIAVNGRKIPFRLPCREEPIFRLLAIKVRNMTEEKEKNTWIKARRVAWRQILRWVEAQMALVETSMVKVDEVFMPYIQVDAHGKTLYERVEEQGFKFVGYLKEDKKDSD